MNISVFVRVCFLCVCVRDSGCVGDVGGCACACLSVRRKSVF